MRPGTDREKREAVLHRWYRQRLRKQIPDLIAKWEPVLGVNVADWGIKRMRTRWGSCKIAARRAWLNLELAKKPSSCLEYILVHEMLHFRERHHNDRFREYMDRFMPQWRLHRVELNRAPRAREDWRYWSGPFAIRPMRRFAKPNAYCGPNETVTTIVRSHFDDRKVGWSGKLAIAGFARGYQNPKNLREGEITIRRNHTLPP